MSGFSAGRSGIFTGTPAGDGGGGGGGLVYASANMVPDSTILAGFIHTTVFPNDLGTITIEPSPADARIAIKVVGLGAFILNAPEGDMLEHVDPFGGMGDSTTVGTTGGFLYVEWVRKASGHWFLVSRVLVAADAMGDNLQDWTSPRLNADSDFYVGYLHRIEGSTNDIQLNLVHDAVSQAGHAVAYQSQGGEGDNGDVRITVPDGSTIESDEGDFLQAITIIQGRKRGVYREWLCQSDGVTWTLRHRQEPIRESSPMVFPFTQRATSTGQTSDEVIGSCDFTPSDWQDREILFTAYLSVAAAGQTAFLDLYDVGSGTLLGSLSANTTIASRGQTWIYPAAYAYGRLYEIRLRCSGGDDSRRAFCQTAALEVRSS